jgi:hypothetical protein
MYNVLLIEPPAQKRIVTGGRFSIKEALGLLTDAARSNAWVLRSLKMTVSIYAANQRAMTFQ